MYKGLPLNTAFLGRDLRLPRPFLRKFPHVPLAHALLPIRCHSSPLQSVHPPLVRMRLHLPLPGRDRTRPLDPQPKPAHLDRHRHRAAFCVFLYSAGYFSGRG